MSGTCSVCGQWLDDIESSSVPQDRCWEHKQSPEEEYAEQDHEPGSSFCQCDNPNVVRTLAKGTPAEKKYCECGGRVDGRDKVLSAIERRKSQENGVDSHE